MLLSSNITEVINNQILTEIPDEYARNTDVFFAEEFSCYELIKKRFFVDEKVYLILPKDYSICGSVDSVLEAITDWEKKSALKNGNTYIVVLPVKRADRDMCMFSNGQSFTHFVLYDKGGQALLYDKDFFYSGSKGIKRIIDICVNSMTIGLRS